MISLAPASQRHELLVCEDVEALTAQASFRIASALDEAVADHGRAVIALSGGATPEPVYDRLGLCILPWSSIHVTLVDERWVPQTSRQSNARLVERSLLAGSAQTSAFLPFRGSGGTPDEAARAVDSALTAIGPLDVVVLGMGEDGHTASLFPGAPELAQGLDLSAKTRCISVKAANPAPAQARITLTLRAILDARLIILLVTGAAKRKVLQDAMKPGSWEQMPIRGILHQTSTPLEIYWAP